MRRMLLQGFHLEALLSRALSSGLRLRSVRRVGPRRMRLAASDPRALSALAERYGVACHDLGPTGLSVLADLLRRRWTLLPAVLLSLFLLLSFSSRVWIVDVESAEGGMSPEEVQALTDAGALTVTLGPRILRTETASVTAAALAMALWGDL